MWISEISFTNIRSFPDAKIELSKGINLLVGRNNSGKSTILLPMLSLQHGLPSLQLSDVRLGQKTAKASFRLQDTEDRFLKRPFSSMWFEVSKSGEQFALKGQPTDKNTVEAAARFAQNEPNNYISV